MLVVNALCMFHADKRSSTCSIKMGIRAMRKIVAKIFVAHFDVEDVDGDGCKFDGRISSPSIEKRPQMERSL